MAKTTMFGKAQSEVHLDSLQIEQNTSEVMESLAVQSLLWTWRFSSFAEEWLGR